MNPEPAEIDAVAAGVLAATPPGIHALDLTPAVRAASESQSLYYRFDAHWNPEGHRVAAEALAAFMAPRLAGER